MFRVASAFITKRKGLEQGKFLPQTLLLYLCYVSMALASNLAPSILQSCMHCLLSLR